MSGFRLRSAIILFVFFFMTAAAAQESPDADNAADGFLLLLGGDFLMGSPSSERLREADEVQPHSPCERLLRRPVRSDAGRL